MSAILTHDYAFFNEMFTPVVSYNCLQFMFHRVDIVFGPFLALWLDLLKAVEFYFVFRGVYELLLDIIFVSKAVEPEVAPNESNVSYH